MSVNTLLYVYMSCPPLGTFCLDEKIFQINILFFFLVDIGKPVSDYQPDWGSMSFLIDFLRPTVSEGPSWYSLLKKAGGGCNDLLYSGHMLVAVLTAMAWTVWFELIPRFVFSSVVDCLHLIFLRVAYLWIFFFYILITAGSIWRFQFCSCMASFDA